MTDADESKNSRTDAGQTPPEASLSTGWRETAEVMEVEAGLPEYINENKDDLVELAEQDYPISPVLKTLLTRYERGEV